MEKIKFFGEGMYSEDWEGCKEFMNQELADIFMEAKKSQGKSYESIGSEVGYSKSQMENFLKGKAWMPAKLRKELRDFLNVQEETESIKMLERLQRAILQAESLEACEEEISQLLMQLDYDYDVAEYNQLEAVQEKQLAQMETWFMEMDYQGCYLLDESYELYEKAQIPDTAWGFIKNYVSMNQKDRDSLRNYMEQMPMPIGEVHRQFEIINRFWKLECQECGIIKDKIKADLVQKDRDKIYTSAEFEQIRRQEHWESFRNKVKKSTYTTSDYFYDKMRFLPSMDNDTWKVLVLFLMLGNGRNEEVSLWQGFFGRIISEDAVKGD